MNDHEFEALTVRSINHVTIKWSPDIGRHNWGTKRWVTHTLTTSIVGRHSHHGVESPYTSNKESWLLISQQWWSTGTPSLRTFKTGWVWIDTFQPISFAPLTHGFTGPQTASVLHSLGASDRQACKHLPQGSPSIHVFNLRSKPCRLRWCHGFGERDHQPLIWKRADNDNVLLFWLRAADHAVLLPGESSWVGSALVWRADWEDGKGEDPRGEGGDFVRCV